MPKDAALVLDALIALSCLAIAGVILRDLAVGGGPMRLGLALATALVFVASGVTHAFDGVALLGTGSADDAGLPFTFADLGTAAIAAWYVSLRGRAVPAVAAAVKDEQREERRRGEERERGARLARERHGATHDSLTGLLNRAAFMVELDAALDPAQANDRRAVLCLHLDEFGDVNDRFGHEIGDTLLVAAGRRLERAVRPDDVLARLGGVRFALLLAPGTDLEHAAGVAARIASCVDGAFDVGAPEAVSITVSVGIALGRPGSDAAASILSDAGDATTLARMNGGARYEAHPHALSPR